MWYMGMRIYSGKALSASGGRSTLQYSPFPGSWGVWREEHCSAYRAGGGGGGGGGGYDNRDLPPTHNNYVSDCIPTARIQYAIYVRVLYLA